jgi:hypothetical protein
MQCRIEGESANPKQQHDQYSKDKTPVHLLNSDSSGIKQIVQKY